ncbi:tripartite tricarboxylate transporter substrate binding protein [Siccirubricoccus sp. KC 17139]|uniref:Tripartite tricarboxylate transporter substrate binding protein n=1 Tax=Siccirubricoccus soli TaxID=2899147 RepID=A0ABT1D164_9PROT|nr:tripartite tricarboxylate transporter substrate binding protein [Siccirubricoccus soli]MCO6415004.1 tripartite tricarboxylate transporter substrate binding protein [Siccirubricoccus soli]MCP2681135.1 tripartite tricarboxylate transporter substrate binding protein [Siccirubricoccus soli]
MLTRRGMLAGAGFALAGPVRAQPAWPDKPIRLLVGFPAGGPTDFAARVLQDALQQVWGQPLVIENRPGASQVIASEAVAKSPPDGYTLLLCTSNLTSNPAVFARLPYDTLRDFTPIVIIYSSPTVLFVGEKSPYRNVQEVIAAAKKHPGMAAATSGVATSGHFATEMFMRAAGIELTHVPYRGAAPALQDVMTGRVPITFSTLSGAIGLARDGKLKPIAIAAPRRTPSFPNVPTMAEQGVEIRDTSPWYSFVGPAGLPEALVNRMASDVQALLKRPEIIQRIESSGGIVEGEGPAEFRARIPREIAINTEVARAANIHIE